MADLESEIHKWVHEEIRLKLNDNTDLCCSSIKNKVKNFNEIFQLLVSSSLEKNTFLSQLKIDIHYLIEVIDLIQIEFYYY